MYVLIHGVLGKGASHTYPPPQSDQRRRTGNFPFCLSTAWGFCAIHIFTKFCEDLTLAGSQSWCEKKGVWCKLMSHQEKPSSSPAPPKWFCAYSSNLPHFQLPAKKHSSPSFVYFSAFLFAWRFWQRGWEAKLLSTARCLIHLRNGVHASQTGCWEGLGSVLNAAHCWSQPVTWTQTKAGFASLGPHVTEGSGVLVVHRLHHRLFARMADTTGCFPPVQTWGPQRGRGVRKLHLHLDLEVPNQTRPAQWVVQKRSWCSFLCPGSLDLSPVISNLVFNQCLTSPLISMISEGNFSQLR